MSQVSIRLAVGGSRCMRAPRGKGAAVQASVVAAGRRSRPVIRAAGGNLSRSSRGCREQRGTTTEARASQAGGTDRPLTTNKPTGGRRPQPARGLAQRSQAQRSQASGRRPARGQAGLTPGQVRPTPGASRARQAAEERSAVPLLFLRQLPSWLLPLVLVALLIAGLALRGPGAAAALVGVALVLAWLALLSWPRLALGGRLGRGAVIALVLGAAVIQGLR
jgi:hypothetical protein